MHLGYHKENGHWTITIMEDENFENCKHAPVHSHNLIGTFGHGYSKAEAIQNLKYKVDYLLKEYRAFENLFFTSLYYFDNMVELDADEILANINSDKLPEDNEVVIKDADDLEKNANDIFVVRGKPVNNIVKLEAISKMETLRRITGLDRINMVLFDKFIEANKMEEQAMVESVGDHRLGVDEHINDIAYPENIPPCPEGLKKTIEMLAEFIKEKNLSDDEIKIFLDSIPTTKEE